MGSARWIAGLYFNLSTLLASGVPLLRALSIAAQNADRRASRLLIQISEDIRRGLDLPAALGRCKVFGRFDLALISAGEQTGRLDESFKMLAEWHYLRNRLNRTAVAALIYPAVILHLAALVFYLPALVLGQIGVFGYIRNVVVFLGQFYLIGIVALIGIRFIRRSRLFADVLGMMLVRIPLVGRPFLNLAICRFARSFEMMYKAAMPIDHALNEAARFAGPPIRAAIRAASTAVAAGQPAYSGLLGRLPAEYVEMWQVGEECGQLDKAVEKIGQLASERAQYGLEQLARWLPRLVYVVVMGMVVAMIFRVASQIGAGYQIPLD